jgi:hypothetical protein
MSLGKEVGYTGVSELEQISYSGAALVERDTLLGT